MSQDMQHKFKYDFHQCMVGSCVCDYMVPGFLNLQRINSGKTSGHRFPSRLKGREIMAKLSLVFLKVCEVGEHMFKCCPDAGVNHFHAQDVAGHILDFFLPRNTTD